MLETEVLLRPLGAVQWVEAIGQDKAVREAGAEGEEEERDED